MLSLSDVESVVQRDYSEKCRNCPSFGAWAIQGMAELVKIRNADTNGLTEFLQQLSIRCADPSEGDNCFAGDDMFNGMLEAGLQSATKRVKKEG